MSADPSAPSRSQQDAPEQLSHPLIAALRQTPGFRRGRPGTAAPWATIWLLGTTAGIATPLAIHSLRASQAPTRGADGSATVAARTEGSRLGLRQASPFRTAAPATTRQGPHQASTTDQALVAAFSALPSPFSGEPLPAGNRWGARPAAGSNPAPGSGAAAPGSPARGGASRLGGALSLADRLDGPLIPAGRPLDRNPRLQADTADPLALRWSDHLQALVKRTPLVLPVEVVRIRSSAVDRSQTIPLALWPDGSATTNVAPPGQSGQRLAQDWVREQPALVEGSVRPVVMVLEPEEAAPVVTTPPAPSRAAVAPPAPRPAWEPATAAPEAASPSAEAAPAPSPSPAAAPSPSPAAAEPPSPVAAVPEAAPAPVP